LRWSSYLKHYLLAGIYVFMLAGQAGCTAVLLGGGGPVPAAGTTAPAGLAETVLVKIGADRQLSGQAIGVSAQGALITLRGRVATSAQRDAAEALARAVSGVSDVDNRLVVQGGS